MKNLYENNWRSSVLFEIWGFLGSDDDIDAVLGFVAL
jgi:hypothetical protein